MSFDFVINSKQHYETTNKGVTGGAFPSNRKILLLVKGRLFPVRFYGCRNCSHFGKLVMSVGKLNFSSW